MLSEKEAYENLANAIILLAVEDYKAALFHQKHNPGSDTAADKVNQLERFFHSDWFDILTPLDADYLIRKVKEQVNE